MKRTLEGEQDCGQLYGEEMKNMDPQGWSGGWERGLDSALASCGEVGLAGGRHMKERDISFTLYDQSRRA